ncbi:MAG: GNAT family N-acetyltransferase [Verrucomicrobia bacterium]|nr:GNAT family N-acetyltransferase [Verrucomicrobiota bacterium]
MAVSAVLHGALPGCYYIDHIATHKDFRRKGLALSLVELVKTTLPQVSQITLDTRVFNVPAQALYQKAGFTKCTIHPNPQKQNAYFHYMYFKA